jgi:hypothetical protein
MGRLPVPVHFVTSPGPGLGSGLSQDHMLVTSVDDNDSAISHPVVGRSSQTVDVPNLGAVRMSNFDHQDGVLTQMVYLSEDVLAYVYSQSIAHQNELVCPVFGAFDESSLHSRACRNFLYHGDDLFLFPGGTTSAATPRSNAYNIHYGVPTNSSHTGDLYGFARHAW